MRRAAQAQAGHAVLAARGEWSTGEWSTGEERLLTLAGLRGFDALTCGLRPEPEALVQAVVRAVGPAEALLEAAVRRARKGRGAPSGGGRVRPSGPARAGLASTPLDRVLSQA